MKEAFPDIDNDSLTRIWSLSDVDQDGRLDPDEFSIACFLVKVKRSGEILPFLLPEHFLASVNPLYLTFRKAVMMEEEEDLAKLRSARYACFPIRSNSCVECEEMHFIADLPPPTHGDSLMHLMMLFFLLTPLPCWSILPRHPRFPLKVE